MSRTYSILIVWVLLFAPLRQSAAQPPPTAPATPQGDIAAEPDAMSEKAAELFREGVKLFQEKKFAQAEAAFEAAWALNQTHKTASNLGQAEINLGKMREAAEHIAFAVRNAPQNDPVREKNERRLAVIKMKLGAFTVTSNVQGAEVLLNGRKVGETPLVDSIFIDPGTVNVRVRAEGYVSWEQALEMAAGQEQSLSATLAKIGPATLPTGTESANPPTTPPPPTRIPIIVLGSLSVVGVAIGTGLLVASGEHDAAATRALEELLSLKPTSCDSPGANEKCTAIASSLQAADDFERASIGVFIGAGVTAAGALGYWLFTRRSPEKAPITAAPMVGRETGGFIVQGNW